MPRASRRPVNETLRIELQDNFALLISSLSSSHDIRHFFEAFLSDEEKIMLTKRLMLHLMLERGYSASEISAVLGISGETVRTHRLVRGKGDAVYREIITKLAAKKKTNDFWKSVESALKPLGYALQAKSSMKARAKLLSGEYD
jgi:uncharacterized protein YerC